MEGKVLIFDTCTRQYFWVSSKALSEQIAENIGKMEQEDERDVNQICTEFLGHEIVNPLRTEESK